jgi:hypothetical protein
MGQPQIIQDPSSHLSHQRLSLCALPKQLEFLKVRWLESTLQCLGSVEISINLNLASFHLNDQEIRVPQSVHNELLRTPLNLSREPLLLWVDPQFLAEPSLDSSVIGRTE